MVNIVQEQNEIQVFVNIYDLNPRETFWDIIVDNIPPFDTYTKEQLIDSIREKGFIYQLKVDEYGNIQNGNMRYWVARYLLEVENDERFRYLPVEKGAINKCHVIRHTVAPKDKDEIQKKVHNRRNLKAPIIPSATCFKEWTAMEDDPKRIDRPEITEAGWDVFHIRQKDKHTTLVLKVE